ncbi:MAG: hypothetical protein ACRD0F_07845, partial [Acidimicrobiales bacterium]
GVLAAAAVALPAPGSLVRLAIVAYPALFAALPTSFYAADGRYLMPLWPFLAVVAGWAVVRYAPRAAAAAVVAAVVVSTAGVGALIRQVGGEPAAVDGAPGSLRPLLDALDAVATDRLYADYWVAYRITLETEGRVVAAPLQVVRNARIEAAVAGATNPPFVLFTGTCYEVALRHLLEARGIGFQAREVSRWTVVQPDRRVAAADGLAEWAEVRGGPPGQSC